MFDGKTLRGSAIERTARKKLLSTLDFEGVLIQAVSAAFSEGIALHMTQAFFDGAWSGGRRTPERQIHPEDPLPPDRCPVPGKRYIPFAAKDHEKRHCRHTTWYTSTKEAPEQIKANWPGSA